MLTAVVIFLFAVLVPTEAIGAGASAAVPDAPVGVLAQRGNAQATVSWTAPASNGSAITAYAVVAIEDPSKGCATKTAVACTVTGLSNGISYRFQVTATNAVGTSAVSTPSAPVTPAARPNAPTAVGARGGVEQAVVFWTAPVDHGSAITAYSVVTVEDPTKGCTTTGATTCTVTGLTNGTSYRFQVTATNGVGTGDASTMSYPVIPLPIPTAIPAAPTGVAATPGNQQATVTWVAADAITSAISGFLVTAVEDPTKNCTTKTATTCNVSGLTNGTSYTFVVVASNSIGASIASSASTPVVPAVRPNAPTSVTAQRGNHQATVSWIAPVDHGSAITAYSVVTVEDPTKGCATTGATTCIVTGLTNGTSYRFQVTATNAMGTSDLSTMSYPVTPAARPDPPTSVLAQRGNQQATVSWTVPAANGSAITAYAVVAVEDPTKGCTTTGATTCVVTGLTNGSSYTFRVSASNGVGSSDPSIPSSSVTPATRPNAPTGVTGTRASTQVSVSWTAPAANGSAITSYAVVAIEDRTKGCTTTGATTCIVTGLTNGSSYTFEVTATNAVGTSAPSAPSSPAIPATVPDAPTGVIATPGDGWVSVSWLPGAFNGGDPVTSYTVTASPGGATCGVSVRIPETDTCRVTGLATGTSYTFSVTATNAVGPSASSTPTPPTVAAVHPDAPTGVTGTRASTQVSVSWTAPAANGSAITSYAVVAIEDRTKGCTTTGATTCIVTGLTNGSSYTFEVTATNAVGTSAPSAPSSPAIPATVPDAPTIVAVSPTTSAVTLTVVPGSDQGSPIQGYVVIGGPTGPSAPTDLQSGTLTIFGLSAATAYRIQVAAVSELGQGPASTAASFSTDPDPTIKITVVFSAHVGDQAGGSSVAVTATGLEPGSQATVTMHSTPTQLGSFTAKPDGTISESLSLPSKFDKGIHQLAVAGVDQSGKEITQTWWFAVDSSVKLLHVTTDPSPSPPNWSLAEKAPQPRNSSNASGPPQGSKTIGGQTFTAYSPASHPTTAQATAVGGAALLGAVGAGGAAGAAGAASGSSGGRASGESRAEARERQKIKHLADVEAANALTRHFLWAVPGTMAFLGFTRTLPSRLAAYSPMLARVVMDGSYLRAPLGMFSMLFPVAGVVLGATAVANVHGAPLPPATWLLAVIMALGILDALAGLLAAATYLSGVVFSGGWATLTGVRVSLAVATAFVLVIVAVSYVRPLRRPPIRSFTQAFDRVGDIVIAGLMAMYVGSKLVEAMPAFAGAELPVAHDILLLAMVTGGAVVTRYVVETLVVEFMPARLAIVQPESLPEHLHRHRVISVLLTATAFGLFAAAFLGISWALWIGLALVTIAAIADAFKHWFPSLPRLRRLTPNGWFKIVLVIFLGRIISLLVTANVAEGTKVVLISAVMLLVPSFVFEMTKATSREGEGYTTTWPMRIAAIPVLVITVLLVIGVITIEL